MPVHGLDGGEFVIRALRADPGDRAGGFISTLFAYLKLRAPMIAVYLPLMYVNVNIKLVFIQNTGEGGPGSLAMH